MMPLVTSLLLAAAAPSIEYSAPEGKGDAPLEKYAFSRWEPGATLFASSDGVNVRSAPDASAPVVTTLGMAAPVTVVAVGPGPSRAGGKVDRWYSVKATGQDGKAVAGHVFGGALTPLAFRADLDGDGELELATVAMSWDFHVRVRVREPALPEEKATATLDLRPAGGGYLGLRGGHGSATLLEAKLAGIPLLHVDSSPEACGDHWDALVSYRSAGPGTAGEVRSAIQLVGVADPPVHQTHDLSYEKDGLRVLTKTQSEDDGPVRSETKRYTLDRRQGLFVERTPEGG